ncbi:MAG TPA: nitrate reductase molybdenum cofactor assembly chaperone [Anaerolineales bacterium]|nr:nitrate reductase molybdenum cofactor assembly chaperone [Anaerolineales bacterium]
MINHSVLPYGLFAGLLEYPTAAVAQQAEQCLEQLKPVHPEAAEAFERFACAMGQYSLEQIQELYTTTFDMQPVCYPYVGYHLFGESYKRGAFMARLNEAYRTFGYSAGEELPDHMSTILRFLGLDAANRQGEFCRSLVDEGLVPALGKMLQTFGSQSENPYHALLSALQLILIHTPEKELGHA